MSKIRTHYDNLKVTRNAPDIVIKAAHKALLQMHHPDKATDKVAAERITRILNEARDVLLDPVKRKQHDDWIKEKERHHHSHHHARHHNGKPAHSQEKTGPNPKETTIGNYIVSTNGTAIATQTGLMWHRFAQGQSWHNDKAQGQAQIYTWQAALDAAKALNRQGGYAGFADWRVPTIDELKTLLDKQTGDKAAGVLFIDSQVFPDSPSWLWSASPYAGYGGGAWFIHFKKGEAINDDVNFARAVRLVRDNKPR